MRGTQHPTGSRVGTGPSARDVYIYCGSTILESIMAKGQQKTTREKKKPKKESKDGVKSESSYKQNFGKK
jgi:hypothetical protein